jgi:hypothetical protein
MIGIRLIVSDTVITPCGMQGLGGLTGHESTPARQDWPRLGPRRTFTRMAADEASSYAPSPRGVGSVFVAAWATLNAAKAPALLIISVGVAAVLGLIVIALLTV